MKKEMKTRPLTRVSRRPIINQRPLTKTPTRQPPHPAATRTAAPHPTAAHPATTRPTPNLPRKLTPKPARLQQPKPKPKPAPKKSLAAKQKTPTEYASSIGRKKQTLTELFLQVFPPSMVPTKKTGWIFGIIFIIAVVIGIFNFPFSSLLAGNVDITIDVGIPWAFLSFDIANPENLPLKFGGLILDLILYLILAYGIDVAINAFTHSISSKNKAKSTSPAKYKLPQKPTTARIAEKTAEKTARKVFKKKQ